MEPRETIDGRLATDSMSMSTDNGAVTRPVMPKPPRGSGHHPCPRSTKLQEKLLGWKRNWPENSCASIVATGLNTQHQPQQPSTKNHATLQRSAQNETGSSMNSSSWPLLSVIGQCTAVPAMDELPRLSQAYIGTTWSVSLN